MSGSLVALAGLILAAVMALIGWWRGRAARQRAAAAEAEADYAKTRKRMDAAQGETRSLGNDPDAARRWLRERDANQP